MAGEHPWVPISQVATAVIGGTPSRNIPEYWNGSVQWATAKDIANVSGRYLDHVEEFITERGLENSAAKLMPRGTVVITARGTVGALAQLGRKMAFNQTCYALVPKDGLDNDFLFYALKGTLAEMQTLTYGTVFETITTQTFDHWKIPLPPLPEQREIAQILGTLDDKIELNRRMNETLEAMARAIFKSWFVDFDPVRSKMARRDPGLSSDIADLFPDRFEDSELGEIPMGWKIGTLTDLAELNPETWSKDIAPNEIEYVDLANTKWGKIEETRRYMWKDAPSRAQRILRPGDTIVGTVRPGNGSFALVTQEGLTGSTGFAVLRPRRVVYEEYIYLAATSSDNIERLTHLADGAAYPAVRPDIVLATGIVQPSESVIQCFSRAVKPLMARTAANSRESDTLVSLRDTLLPKLISGELQIPDPERIIGRQV